MSDDDYQGPTSTNGGATHRSIKRSWQQREYDLSECARLYALGKTQREIAEFIAKNRPYSLSSGQINTDMKEILARWRKACVQTVEDHKARALAEINELYRQYHEAWEASKKPITEVHTEEIDDKTTSSKNVTLPAYQRRKKQSTVKGSYGDERFLQGMERCIKMRCKILGLEAPEVITVHNWREEARKSGIDAGELFNDMVGKFVKKQSDVEGLDE